MNAISNSSPLLYLHRIDALGWLSALFSEIWVPDAVREELAEGARRGYDVPHINHHEVLVIRNPQQMPSEWLVLDLGPGELAAMALALENPERIVLLDDAVARRTAEAAGLLVWGTLRILLEAKNNRLIPSVKPHVDKLIQSGMWISPPIQQRILALANET